MRYFLLILVSCISSVCYSQIRVTSDPKTNSLIVRAPKEQQEQIKKVLQSLDDPYEKNICKVVPLRYLFIDDVITVLNNVMSVLKPVRNKSNNFDPSLDGIVLGDSRTNQIIIISDKYTNEKLEQIIKQLDKKIKLEDNTFLHVLKNAKADSIANIVNGISRR